MEGLASWPRPERLIPNDPRHRAEGQRASGCARWTYESSGHVLTPKVATHGVRAREAAGPGVTHLCPTRVHARDPENPINPPPGNHAHTRSPPSSHPCSLPDVHKPSNPTPSSPRLVSGCGGEMTPSSPGFFPGDPSLPHTTFHPIGQVTPQLAQDTPSCAEHWLNTYYALCPEPGVGSHGRVRPTRAPGDVLSSHLCPSPHSQALALWQLPRLRGLEAQSGDNVARDRVGGAGLRQRSRQGSPLHPCANLRGGVLRPHLGVVSQGKTGLGHKRKPSQMCRAALSPGGGGAVLGGRGRPSPPG